MIAIPAVDLREGSCVQLVGGSYASERVRLENPLAVAREFARCGFSRLHVVDLDAATERGSNRSVILDLLLERDADLQVGGGLRDSDAVGEVLAAGARYAMVGTRALEDLDWLAEVAGQFPGEIILCADVRGPFVSVRGWSRTLGLRLLDLLEETFSLLLGGILVTSVEREGRLEGPDLAIVEAAVEATPIPILAAGGITTLADLRRLEERGASAAVIGMALYTGALDPRLVAGEFAA
ncbi:MAG TPA: HisA/HisF-related TIM barrel protein [Gemmatimonadaceae bacterium]|nr:HisA/HisF-related TIM barrel protein [Gemmatimonadaceae bacterium]